MTFGSRRRALVAAAVCMTVAAALLAVILGAARSSDSVTTLGTLRPDPTAVAPMTTMRPVGTAPGTTPSTAAPTTTTTATTATTAPRAPSTTARRPTPTVPPAPPAPAPLTDPFHLSIPSIGVDASIVAVGVEPGTNTMQIPDLDHVGWYQFGSMPGDDGTAVLVGHVDGNGRDGVFFHLGELAPGDRFTVGLPDGRTREFSVTGRQELSKQALPTDLFERGGPPRLALITCGGAFDRATGHYLDNIVIVATPVT